MISFQSCVLKCCRIDWAPSHWILKHSHEKYDMVWRWETLCNRNIRLYRKYFVLGGDQYDRSHSQAVRIPCDNSFFFLGTHCQHHTDTNPKDFGIRLLHFSIDFGGLGAVMFALPMKIVAPKSISLLCRCYGCCSSSSRFLLFFCPQLTFHLLASDPLVPALFDPG